MVSKGQFKSIPFFKSLYKESEGYINIRIFPQGESIFISASNINSIVGIKRKFRNKNISFGAATRNKNDDTESEIIDIPALWCDIDLHGRTQEELWDEWMEFPLKTSAIVNKGGGYQLYWFLKTPATIDQLPQIELLLKRLGYFFRGTRSAVEDSHILRVPGSKNLERDGYRTRLEIFKPERQYLISDFDILPLLAEEKFPWLTFANTGTPFDVH